MLLHEHLATFVESVSGDAGTKEMASFIASLPAARRREAIAAHAEARRFPCLDGILDVASLWLGNAPRESLALADLVLGVLAAPPATAPGDRSVLYLEGRAWRERACAECELGNVVGALRSFHQAVALYMRDPRFEVEVAAVSRGAAFVFHRRGNSEAALDLLRASTRAFEAHDEASCVAKSLLLEGIVHFELGRVETAAAVFEHALRLSKRLGDELTTARLDYHLGNCERARGNRAGAMKLYRRALPVFRHAGMVGDRLRVTWAMAHFLVDDGSIDAAIHAFENVIAEMSAAGLVIDEALARCDLAEILVLAEEHERAAEVGRGVLDTLGRARMLREASVMVRILGGFAGYDEDDAHGEA